MNELYGFFSDIKLTSLEREVLKYITENIETCSGLGVREVAKNAFTSPSTVMRLSKKLGYKGFLEMIYDLKIKYVHDSQFRYLEDYNDNIFFKPLSDDSIDMFLDCLDRDNIYIFAAGVSSIVAQYFYVKLLTIGKKCTLSSYAGLDIFHNAMGDSIKSVIMISKSGMTSFCVENAIRAKKYEIPVFAFTGNEKSRLVKNSTTAFIVNDYEKQDYTNYYPNSFFGYCIDTFESLLLRYYLKKSKLCRK